MQSLFGNCLPGLQWLYVYIGFEHTLARTWDPLSTVSDNCETKPVALTEHLTIILSKQTAYLESVKHVA